MIKNLKKHLDAVGLSLLTLVIYFLTRNPITKGFSLQMTLALLLVFLGFLMFRKKKDKEKSSLQSKGFLYLLISFCLFLIGSTGWSFSPFFFVLYLLAIMTAFVFSIQASLAFVATLVILFSFSIGEVDLAYDFMVVLSLLTVVPLSFYLRKEYIKLKEASKEILVLQDQKKYFEGIVEEVLANKMHNFSVNIRQPINDAKQLAYMIEKAENKNAVSKNVDRIIASSDEALRLLKKFEEDVTGKRLLTTPGGSIPDASNSPDSKTR